MAKLSAFTASGRAATAWRRISDKPTVITIFRDEAALASQTVRIEYGVAFRENTGGAGKVAIGTAVVFGIVDHETRTDTDIQRTDQFLINSVFYRVTQIVSHPGEVQALCEAIQ